MEEIMYAKEISEHYYKIIDLLWVFTPKLITAILIWFVGGFVIKNIRKLIRRVMEKREFEPTLANFVSDLINWLLRLVLFVTVIAQLGVPTTSFVAILGAAGLAIGLSLQGSLSNFAGGVLIVLFKPFRVGDFIQAHGEMGTVQQIQIFVTKIATPNNQILYIPNGALSNSNITNFSQSEFRRADLTIGISYGSDIKKAREIAFEVMKNHPLVLEEPAPSVWVSDLADSSINFAVRPWANNADFWQMRSEILTQIKEAFDHQGIEIPFPQRDIHIKTKA